MNAAASATPRPATRIDQAKTMLTITVLSRMFGVQGELGRSCRVSQDDLRFIDFRTGERSDAVNFLAKIKRISNPEASLELLKMADGAIPESTAVAREPEVKMNAPSQPLLPGLDPQEGGAAL